MGASVYHPPILEVAVWSQPYGRHRGPLPRRRRSRAQARDTFAASASSRRTFRYNSVEKRAVFGPEMVGRRNVHNEEYKRRAGLRAPLEKVASFSSHFGVHRRFWQSVVHDDVGGYRPSAGKRRCHRRLLWPPRPLPADVWLKASDFTVREVGRRYDGASYVSPSDPAAPTSAPSFAESRWSKGDTLITSSSRHLDQGEAVDSRGQGCRNIKFFSSARDSSP